jgi:hypothetical protein
VENTTMTKQTDDNVTDERWLAIRKEAALHIDPETAEVCCERTDLADPFGLHPDRPAECIGKVWFARSPDGVWVLFDDLPRATREALWARKDEWHLRMPPLDIPF